MVKRITRQYEMLLRTHDFGRTHAELFPAGSLGAEMLLVVEGSIAEIALQETNRLGAVGEGRQGRLDGRKSLARTLTRIRQTSRLLALEETPAGESFPRWTGRRGDRSLLHLAQSYAADAAPLADRFIAHGMPATFIADLQAQIDGLAAGLDRRQQARRTTGEAHSRTQAALNRGMLAVRQLDAFLANSRELADPLLATWKGIRRIGPVTRNRNARKDEVSPAGGGPEPAPTRTVTAPINKEDARKDAA